MANFIMDLLCIILLVTFFIPQVRLLSFYQYIWLGAMLGWVIVSFLTNRKFYLGNSNFVILSLIYSLFTILIPYTVGVLAVGNRYLSLFSVVIFYWIYGYNSIYRGLEANMKIIYYSVPMILYTSITTLIALFNNPWVVRMIKSEGEETMLLLATGISGYGLIYSVLILVISLVPLILERNMLRMKWIYKLSLIGFVFLGGLLVIYSNYFTALGVLLFAISLLLTLYYSKKMIFKLLPIVFIYLIFSTDINLAIVNGLMDIVPTNGRTYDRLVQIQNQMQGVVLNTDINSRSEVMEISFNTINQYPIEGSIIGNSAANFDLNQIGQHSYTLDTFAFFGVFIGGFMIYIMTIPFLKRMRKGNPYRLRVFAVTVGGVFFTLITTNNLTPTMGYAALFVFPTIYDYLNTKIYGQNSLYRFLR